MHAYIWTYTHTHGRTRTRTQVVKAGITVQRLRGGDIQTHHWDAFFQFYLNTVDDKWGQVVLSYARTHVFFPVHSHIVSVAMHSHICVCVCTMIYMLTIVFAYALSYM